MKQLKHVHEHSYLPRGVAGPDDGVPGVVQAVEVLGVHSDRRREEVGHGHLDQVDLGQDTVQDHRPDINHLPNSSALFPPNCVCRL